MRIGIISGSHRKNSQSIKVAKYIQSILKVDQTVFELATLDLPLWDEAAWNKDSELSQLWKPTSERLKSCDGFIAVSPEWSGMVPAALKNFFLYCSRDELAHKPGLIVAVSAGIGGSYPVAELRSSSYKNTRICWIPEHVIVRNVEACLNEAPSENPSDGIARQRLAYATNVLISYTNALQQVRASGVIDSKLFGNGM